MRILPHQASKTPPNPSEMRDGSGPWRLCRLCSPVTAICCACARHKASDHARAFGLCRLRLIALSWSALTGAHARSGLTLRWHGAFAPVDNTGPACGAMRRPSQQHRLQLSNRSATIDWPLGIIHIARVPPLLAVFCLSAMDWHLPFLQRDTLRLGSVGPFGLVPYVIPNTSRTTHMYVIGTTGQGKSKFLENLIVADIRAGRGCGLVDPHSDLVRDVLAHLLSDGYFRDPAALERIFYFDPTRSDYTIPFNVLATPGTPYGVAQQVIEAFRRTWPKSLEEAPQFANIALAALLVLIATGHTLIDMGRLLTDEDFRNDLLSRVADQSVVAFFHGRFDRWGRDGPRMIESTLNKVSAFSLNPYLRRLLGARENKLDFRKIMDGGQVLLVDLGNCDGETRRLVGSLVVTGMEMAALSRKDTQAQRRPYNLFLDEFQDFCANDGAAKTLAQILSECRKFGLHLHLAHQTIGQLRDRIASALGNVGTKVVFCVDRDDAEVMARKLFAVNTLEVKREAQTQTQHPVYSSLPEQWERAVAAIQSLTPRHAFVKQRGRPVQLMTTDRVPAYRAMAHDIDEIKLQLAAQHGALYTNIEHPIYTSPKQAKKIAADWGKPATSSSVLPTPTQTSTIYQRV